MTVNKGGERERCSKDLRCFMTAAETPQISCLKHQKVFEENASVPERCVRYFAAVERCERCSSAGSRWPVM